jgi:hypothetical protein
MNRRFNWLVVTSNQFAYQVSDLIWLWNCGW